MTKREMMLISFVSALAVVLFLPISFGHNGITAARLVMATAMAAAFGAVVGLVLGWLRIKKKK